MADKGSLLAFTLAFGCVVLGLALIPLSIAVGAKNLVLIQAGCVIVACICIAALALVVVR